MERERPERTCVGCRTKRVKSEFVRIVRGADGSTVVDPTRKRPGRGAYLCPSLDCLETAIKRRALDRALKGPVPPEEMERLRAQIVYHSGGVEPAAL